MLAALLLALAATASEVELDVTYSKVGGQELKMDIYRAASATGPTPAAVVIHGGAWMTGTRKDMKQLAEALAREGITAASVTYRLAPKSIWPAMLDDVQTAVRYLRANAQRLNIDPNRIGATGASAGGHLAVFLGVRDTRDPKPAEYPEHSSKVKAVFDIFGPTDMSNMTDFPANMDIAFQLVLGKPRNQAASEVRDASPINFVGPTSAPMFILQGLVDPLVPPNQSKALEAKLRENKVLVQAVYVDGMGHEIPMTNPKVREAMEQGVRWFVSELKR